MGRKKKEVEDVVVNTVKTEKRDIRHGCPDCTYWECPVTKQPCKGCEKYSAWEDKRLINNDKK